MANKITELARRLEPFLLQIISSSPGAIPDGADDTAIHDNVAAEISAITEKSTPADADLIIIEDSAASYAKKKVQLSNLPGGGGDVGDWIDYSSSTSVTGFSSVSTTIVYYQLIGSTIFVAYVINGTSNANSFTFTIPYDNAMSWDVRAAIPRVIDNNVDLGTAHGLSEIWTGENIVRLYPNKSSTNDWTTSGQKGASGQFFCPVTIA